MLTRRPAFRCISIDKSPQLSFKFFASRRIPHHSNYGVGIDRRDYFKRVSIQASHAPGSIRSRASLAYVRSLSINELKAAQPSTNAGSVNRFVTETVAERTLAIPYADRVLRRKLDEGHSLIEAIESISNRVYCWEEAWKLYMQSQTAALKELSAHVEACSPQITTIESGSSTDEPIPHEFLSSIVDEVSLEATCSEENICEGPPQKKEPSLLSKSRAKKLKKRRTRGLILLNVLAALYGSSTVAGKFATDVAPGLPPSLSSLVRFSSALLVFLPVLINIVSRGLHFPLMKAGAELGGLLFVAAILETCGNGGASSDAPLLFAFTVIFVPIMELCAGRQSVRNITRIASLVALSGMGVLEEEGLGWKGISLPQVGDVWGLAASAIYALHIFRSEAHSKNFKPFELTAIQCATVDSLTLVWEIFRLLLTNTTPMQYMSQLQSLPWGPLLYTGLVSSGLCSWLEIHGLRSIHASTATMVNTTIPIWGAFLSFFLRGETLDDSAIVGGSVILVASIFAQLLTNQDDTEGTPPQEAPNPKTPNHQLDPPIPNSVSAMPAADHLQSAIITSQLKFPYYAAQAKRLLLDAKIKVMSVKCLIISAASTFLNVDSPQGLHGGAPTAIATSVSLRHAATQTLITNTAPSGSHIPSTGAHAAMAVQWLDVAAGFLESAIMALGSDMVQAVEEVEYMAKLAEHASQSAMAFITMAAASASSLLDMATRIFVEFFQSFDTATASALAERSFACAHHVDVAVLQIFLGCGPPNP